MKNLNRKRQDGSVKDICAGEYDIKASLPKGKIRTANESLEDLGISYLRNFAEVKVFNKGRLKLACFHCTHSKMHIADKGINIIKQPSILIQSRKALILSLFLRKNINSLFQILQSFVPTSILKLLYFDLLYSNDVTINMLSHSRL